MPIFTTFSAMVSPVKVSLAHCTTVGMIEPTESLSLNGPESDRHQFRFIVSPEDGDKYPDLKSFVRRLMARMEKDLDTRLDWVAADHYNTGHPHSHIIVRGEDETGKDLIIAREYITHGLRERAAEIVGLDLGPRSDLEILDRLRNEMEQERFTGIDRDLLRTMNAERMVAAIGNEPFDQSLRAGRLQKLGRLGLATEIAPGRWQLSENLQATLGQAGERGDIIRTMQRGPCARTGREAICGLCDLRSYRSSYRKACRTRGGAGDFR